MPSRIPKMREYSCVRDPWDHCQARWVTRNSAFSRTPGCDLLQQENPEQNHQREKAHGWLMSRESQVQAHKSPLPVESHRMCLSPPAKSYETHVKCLLSGSSLETQFPGLVMEAPTYQDSSLPEGKQMFNTNHTVCANSLGTGSHSYQSWEWWERTLNPSFQMQSRACYVNSFLHNFPTH